MQPPGRSWAGEFLTTGLTRSLLNPSARTPAWRDCVNSDGRCPLILPAIHTWTRLDRPGVVRFVPPSRKSAGRASQKIAFDTMPAPGSWCPDFVLWRRPGRSGSSPMPHGFRRPLQRLFRAPPSNRAETAPIRKGFPSTHHAGSSRIWRMTWPCTSVRRRAIPLL